jgi:hypothetical protein
MDLVRVYLGIGILPLEYKKFGKMDDELLAAVSAEHHGVDKQHTEQRNDHRNEDFKNMQREQCGQGQQSHPDRQADEPTWKGRPG